MNQKISWYHWVAVMFKAFLVESAKKAQCQVVDVYECEKSGFIKVVVKLSDRHTIEKNMVDLILDNDLLEMLDKKTVRTLTYMATVESLKPDHSIVAQEMTNEIDHYILEIKSKNSSKIIKKSPSEISKNTELINRFNPIEANKIGYMAGVCETVMEYHIMRNQN